MAAQDLSISAPDTELVKNIDQRFFQQEALIRVDVTANPQMYGLLDKIGIPQIDVDANPGTLSILQFLHDLRKIKPQDDASKQAVAKYAFRGTTGQE